MTSFTSSSVFNSQPSAVCPVCRLLLWYSCSSLVFNPSSRFTFWRHYGENATLSCWRLPFLGLLTFLPTQTGVQKVPFNLQAARRSGPSHHLHWGWQLVCTRSGITCGRVLCPLRGYAWCWDMCHLNSYIRHRGNLLTEETLVYPVSRTAEWKTLMECPQSVAFLSKTRGDSCIEVIVSWEITWVRKAKEVHLYLKERNYIPEIFFKTKFFN